MSGRHGTAARRLAADRINRQYFESYGDLYIHRTMLGDKVCSKAICARSAVAPSPLSWPSCSLLAPVTIGD